MSTSTENEEAPEDTKVRNENASIIMKNYSNIYLLRYVTGYPASRGFFRASLFACAKSFASLSSISRRLREILERDANGFVHAKSLTRKKPLLAG